MADVLKQKIHTQMSHQLLIPAQLKRCGMEMKLIIEGDEQLAVSQSSLNTLQASLPKGLYWHDRLVSGQNLSINQIAKNEGVTRIYVLRRVRMAYLAPDIIKAIIKGQIPHTMNFSQIKEAFPCGREERRRLFGFICVSAARPIYIRDGQYKYNKMLLTSRSGLLGNITEDDNLAIVD